MAAVDPPYVPRLNDRMLHTVMEPAEVMNHGEHETSTQAYKAPPTDIRTLNDRILDKARQKYKNIFYQHMYPFGFNFVNMRHTSGKEHPVTEGSGSSLKALKKKLWKKAYKKAHKKLSQKKYQGKGSEMPARPKTKEIFGQGLYSISGHGTEARGTEARGFASHAALAELEGDPDYKAQGGFIGLATAASLAAPMIIKGIKGLAKMLSGRGGSGAGPTEYQMQQATAAAEKAKKRGLVGFPNPMSYPKYPPITNIVDGPSVIRDVFNKTRTIMHKAAQGMGIPAKVGVPFTNKYIKKFAQTHFGRGGAKMLFAPSMSTGLYNKPLTMSRILRPIFAKNAQTEPELQKILLAMKNPMLKQPLTGEGIGSMIASLASTLMGKILPAVRTLAPKALNLVKGVATNIGRVAKKVAPSLIPSSKMAEIAMETLIPMTPMMAQARQAKKARKRMAIIADPETDPRRAREMEEEDFPGGQVRLTPEYFQSEDVLEGEGYAKLGKLATKGGSKAWNMIKKIGRSTLEFGAPIMGAVIGEKFDSKPLRKIIAKTGVSIGQTAGQQRRLEDFTEHEIAKELRNKLTSEELITKYKAEQESARKLMQEEKDRAIAEYKEARRITPDEYKNLRQEAESARYLAEMLKNTKLKGPNSSDFADSYRSISKAYKPTALSFESAPKSDMSDEMYQNLFGPQKESKKKKKKKTDKLRNKIEKTKLNKELRKLTKVGDPRAKELKKALKYETLENKLKKMKKQTKTVSRTKKMKKQIKERQLEKELEKAMRGGSDDEEDKAMKKKMKKLRMAKELKSTEYGLLSIPAEYERKSRSSQLELAKEERLSREQKAREKRRKKGKFALSEESGEGEGLRDAIRDPTYSAGIPDRIRKMPGEYIPEFWRQPIQAKLLKDIATYKHQTEARGAAISDSYKPQPDLMYRIGPTSADSFGSKRRAKNVMIMSKKIGQKM